MVGIIYELCNAPQHTWQSYAFFAVTLKKRAIEVGDLTTMAYKMRTRAIGLSVNVSDSNSKSPALKRPIDAVVGTAKMNKDSPVKNIWLIRHGESEHNTASDWGIRDPGLTDQGWRQAKALKHEPLLKGALGQYEGTEQMASTSPFINLTRKSPFLT